MRYKGLNSHRIETNHLEKVFAEEWDRINKPANGICLIDILLSDYTNPVEASKRDRIVAATIIQWLGSPVGNDFVRGVLAKAKEPS